MHQIEQFGQLELAYTAQGRHPGFAGTVTARFEHESGRSVAVSGFYDGEDSYRLRFMPALTGRWDYRVESELSLAGELLGELTVNETQLPGLLQVDPDHPYHFRFARGERFFPLGNTAYNLLSTFRGAPGEADAFLQYYSDRGFNWVRFILQQVTWPTVGGPVWPWGGAPDEPDFETYNLELFRLADRAIRRLAELNSIASVILLHPADEPLQRLGQESSERLMRVVKRYVDYVVARLGSHWNVVWNVANEWARGDTFDAAQMDAIGQHLHETDPYEHLTACHDNPCFEFPHAEWTDMSSMQHRGLPHEVNRVAQVNRAFNKPVLNEEYGYELDTNGPPNDPVNVRRDHWALTMAGAYGTYGDKTKGPKIATYFSATLKDAINTQLPEMLGNIRQVMEQLHYWKMSPCNGLLRDCIEEEVFCLADPGREYIIYFAVGQEVTVDLIHVMTGAVTHYWFDPRTGEKVDSGSHKLRSDVRRSREFRESRLVRFIPPDYVQDWVLVIKVEKEF